MDAPLKTKVCSKCHRRRKAKFFNKKKNSKDGLAFYCRDCQKAYHSTWSRTKKAVTRRRERQRENSRKLRSLLEDLKSVPCADCGQRYPFYVMDFDHVSGKKRFSIAHARQHLSSLSSSTLMREIKKCEVVCSNCHRERTWKRQQCSLVHQ